MRLLDKLISIFHFGKLFILFAHVAIENGTSHKRIIRNSYRIICVVSANNCNIFPTYKSTKFSLSIAGLRIRETLQAAKVPIGTRKGTLGQFNPFDTHTGKFFAHFDRTSRAILREQSLEFSVAML